MYVKEDLVLPHNMSFYDLIISKARGKSGPLFHFDVYDDVRLEHNANVEKEESHAGEILQFQVAVCSATICACENSVKDTPLRSAVSHMMGAIVDVIPS